MDIDMGALRALERERDIRLPVLLDAIRQALHAAYMHTDHPVRTSEVVIDEKTGEVAVIARELAEDGTVVEEWDDTPENFGRVAASTARQVIFQRIRDLEDEAVLGEYADRTEDIVSGIIQQGRDPRMVMVDLGEVEAVLALINRVKARGVAVVLVTHRMQDLFRVCDRIAVMYEGTKVAERLTPDTNLQELVDLIVGKGGH